MEHYLNLQNVKVVHLSTLPAWAALVEVWMDEDK
jgi:hypothetical protein